LDAGMTSKDINSDVMKNRIRQMNKAQEPIYEIIQEPEVDEHSELDRL
jgi:hypothetical protein